MSELVTERLNFLRQLPQVLHVVIKDTAHLEVKCSVWCKRLLFKPEIWAGDVRAWVKCTVPPSMQDRATALATPLHPTQRSHFSAPVSRPVFCQLYLHTAVSGRSTGE